MIASKLKDHTNNNHILLGIDVGTSFIKVAAIDAATQQCIAFSQFPETETEIISLQKGWAEQSPESWWQHTLQAIKILNQSERYNPLQIKAIGIAYQMHGLVLVDKDQNVLRNSIIWCDSRAVDIGHDAFEKIGAATCSSCLLNSPGNFTASKLAWVKQNEPEIFNKIYKAMLPGDFIAMKFTGNITTTSSALSEGILWDFKQNNLSKDVMECFDFDKSIIPDTAPLFFSHGKIKKEIADELQLNEEVVITYKAGDQLNNALSLNVLKPGEVAATAGTSGVIYAVTDTLFSDKKSRVNSFAHVNHKINETCVGVLLCINGTGIMNSWIKKLCGEDMSYKEMDELAGQIKAGSEGLFVLPFGNGAERMFENKIIGAHIHNIDLNTHTKVHIFRAVQEGIAFAFRYGLDIMRENGLQPKVIRAGKSNLFLSEVFIQSFVNATGVTIELYENDGSAGAALGAGLGAGIYKSFDEAFTFFKPIKTIEPSEIEMYNDLYTEWKNLLHKHLE